MNKDVLEMIALQRLWDKKIKLESEISHHEKSVNFWENKLKQLYDEISRLKEQIKKTEIDMRTNEKKLYELEEKISKLQKRRDIIKTEKELSALEKEINTLIEEKDKIETVAIEAMDTIAQLKALCTEKETELAKSEPQIQNDITYLQNKILECTHSLNELIAQFNTKLSALSPDVKLKFEKIIKSKDGKAIAAIEENACSACHTIIPLDIVAQATKNDKVINCTNCGRFLYRKDQI